MRIFLLLFFLTIVQARAQHIEVLWSEAYEKELQMTCAPQELLCEGVCGASSACVVKEGFCLSCIGTGLQMYHLFTEIGRSIRPAESTGPEAVALLLVRGDFVTFSARDAYNLIDAHGSLAVLKKFESLCPRESLNQILFFRVHHETRKLLSPEFLYCEASDGVRFFKVEDKILIEKGSLMRLSGAF